MLSTPSLGITFLANHSPDIGLEVVFQLPLSGSRAVDVLVNASREGIGTFNSLSRDHEWPEEMPADIFTADFQLPLSGSLKSAPSFHQRYEVLSTPSLGITK